MGQQDDAGRGRDGDAAKKTEERGQKDNCGFRNVDFGFKSTYAPQKASCLKYSEQCTMIVIFQAEQGARGERKTGLVQT
jgi:hypothetical protein